MAQGWAIVRYEVDAVKPNRRVCAIERFANAIIADGGSYSYRECLGDSAVVKVAGVTAATLTAIAADAAVQRFPGANALNANLGILTANQWTNYRNFALALGYPAAEWDAAFPLDKSNYTLRDVIVFLVKRRVTPRYDAPTTSIIFDGSVVNQDVAALAAAIEASVPDTG